MPPAPPALLVAIMNRAIPPASREAVLGDLWESYRSPTRFVGRGLAIIPFLVISQVRRRSSWPILGLQAFILFACLRGFQATETMPAPWMRALLPTLFAFLALAWHDAYGNGQDEPTTRPAWGEVAGVVVAVALSQLLTWAGVATAGLPRASLLSGLELLSAASALPILCLFRWGSTRAEREPAIENACLARDYARFCSSVSRRNRLEIGAIGATLFISGVILMRVDGPVPLVVWSTLLGFLGLLLYLVRRGGAPVARPGLSAEEMRRLFGRELVRQSKLRSLLVWWWLTPLFLGLAMNFIIAKGPATLQARQLVGVVLILGLAACISAYNAERAETVRRRTRALEAAKP